MSIITSATILGALCLAVCAITTNAIIGQVTLLIGRGAIISAVLILFVLPALLIAITRKPPNNNDIFSKIKSKIATKLMLKKNKKVQLETSEDNNLVSNDQLESVEQVDETQDLSIQNSD